MRDMANTAPGDMALIVQALRDAEAHIMRLVAQAASRGATGTEVFYRRQHGELLKVLAGADKALDAALSKAGQEVAGLIAANYAEAATNALPGALPPAIPEEAINATATEVAGALVSAKPAVLRAVDDMYRRVTQVATIRGLASGEALQSRLQQALNLYADQGLTAYVDAAGRRWGIDTYAEMALRTATNRAQNDGRRAMFQAHGVDLIRISAHVACAPQCLPYQGKVLSINGPAGVRTLQGLDGAEYTVEVVANRADAIAAGYRHPNCRHTETAYIPGSPEPEPVDTNDEDYRAEQRQRQIERNIRDWKRREAVALTPKEAARARAKVRYWQGQQRAHVGKYSWMSRRYDREKLRIASGPGGAIPAGPKLTPKPTLETFSLPEGWAGYKPTAGAITDSAISKVNTTIAKTPTDKWFTPAMAPAWGKMALAQPLDSGWVSVGVKAQARKLMQAEAALEHAKAALDGKAFYPMAGKPLEQHVKQLTGKRAEARKLFQRKLQERLHPDGATLIKAAQGKNLLEPEKKRLAANEAMTKAQMLKKKQPFSSANSLSMADYVISKNALNPGVFKPETIAAARRAIEADIQHALAKSLDDSVHASLKAQLAASLKSAKKAMSDAVKLDPDMEFVKQALKGAAANDKTTLALAKKFLDAGEAIHPTPAGKTFALPDGISHEEMKHIAVLNLHSVWGEGYFAKKALAKKVGLSIVEMNHLANRYVSYMLPGVGDKAFLITTAGKQAAKKAVAKDYKAAAAWAKQYEKKPTVKPSPKPAVKPAVKPVTKPSRDKAQPGLEPVSLTQAQRKDEALSYMVHLRTAEYWADLEDAVEAYAEVHGLLPADVQRLVVLLGDEMYPELAGEAAKNLSVEQARKLLDEIGRKKVGAKGSLVPEKSQKFQASRPDVLVHDSDEKGKEWAARRWMWQKEKYAPGELDAIRGYTGQDYEKINSAERLNRGESPWKAKVRDEIDREIARSTRPAETVVLRRGTGYSQFTKGVFGKANVDSHPESWVGVEFIDWSYMSTSVGAKSAFYYKKPIELVLKVPAGTKMKYLSTGTGPGTHISHYDTEREMLLGRQTTFKVTSTYTKGGKIFVEAEVTGQRV